MDQHQQSITSRGSPSLVDIHQCVHELSRRQTDRQSDRRQTHTHCNEQGVRIAIKKLCAQFLDAALQCINLAQLVHTTVLSTVPRKLQPYCAKEISVCVIYFDLIEYLFNRPQLLSMLSLQIGACFQTEVKSQLAAVYMAAANQLHRHLQPCGALPSSLWHLSTEEQRTNDGAWSPTYWTSCYHLTNQTTYSVA